MMKYTIAAIVLVVASMTAMADESKVDGNVLLDTSVINAKLEQILQDRLRSEVAEDTAAALEKSGSEDSAHLLMHTMDYFKVDTSLPE